MKNKLRRDIFVIIFLLLVACIALAVPLAFSNPRWLLAPALLVVFALVVAVLGIRRLRRFVADMLCGTNFEGSKTQYSLAVKMVESLVSLGLTTSKHGDLAYPERKTLSGKFAVFND